MRKKVVKNNHQSKLVNKMTNRKNHLKKWIANNYPKIRKKL